LYSKEWYIHVIFVVYLPNIHTKFFHKGIDAIKKIDARFPKMCNITVYAKSSSERLWSYSRGLVTLPNLTNSHCYSRHPMFLTLSNHMLQLKTAAVHCSSSHTPHAPSSTAQAYISQTQNSKSSLQHSIHVFPVVQHCPASSFFCQHAVLHSV